MIGLANSTNNYKYNTSELKKEIESLSESYKNAKKSIEDNVVTQEAELTYTEQLKTSLSEMIDTNGKVKDGYQERAKIVLGELSEALGKEYKMTDNNIYINGELVKSYSDLEKSVDDTIKAKKREIELEATKSLLTEAIKQEAKAKREVAKAQENLNEKIAKYNENPWNILDANAVNEAKETLDEAQKALSDASDEVQGINKDFTDKMVQTTGEFSAQMIQQGQLSRDTLRTMAKEQTDTFLTEINKMDEGNQALYLGMVTTADTMSPKLIEKWKELAIKSDGEYLGHLSVVDDDTKATILSAITTTENMTDGMKFAWSDLATSSKDRFNKALSTLPEDVQGQILASIIAVNGMDETNRQAYENLSANAKMAFNNAMNGMDSDAKNKVQSAINEINGQSSNAYNAGYSVGDNANRGARNGQGDATQLGKDFGNGYANGIWGVVGAVNKAAKDVVNSALRNVALAQNSHSPSKKTRKLGNDNGTGFVLGIKDMIPDAIRASKDLALGATKSLNDNLEISEEMNELTQGIKINTKDFSVDANQYVDYGAIKGQLQTQSNVTVSSNIVTDIVQAIKEGISESEVNVNIEAKTEEGTIVRKASQGFKDYVMQTGELPFPVPV